MDQNMKSDNLIDPFILEVQVYMIQRYNCVVPYGYGSLAITIVVVFINLVEIDAKSVNSLWVWFTLR